MADPNENDPPRERPWDRGGAGRDDDRPRRRRDEDERDDREDDRPRRRRYEDDDDYDDRPRRRGGAKAESGNGLAVAGLILGILSFCTGITALPGLICSALAMTKPTGRGMAIAGLILNILGGVVSVGGMFYAVSKVRTAATRLSDANNMKQVGLGMLNDQDSRGSQTQYARDKFGMPQSGLSFRVGILPYIEQNSLYNQFDLTQPWDSPANRSLSNTRIKTYTSPFDGPEPSANTPYRVFVGGGALFNEDGRPVSVMNITDGTSNTIMLVHAAEYVPWAEPRELRYGADAPLPRLGHAAQPEGSNVLMADGSVRFIRKTVSEKTMRALITRAGGETIGSDF